MCLCGNALAQTQDTEPDSRGYKVKVGDMAPDFDLKMPDGSTVKLSSLRGKVVMIQFTATWCGVCRKEMPHIEKEIWQKYKDNKNFALYGIHTHYDTKKPLPSQLAELVKATNVTYPIGLDYKSEIFSQYTIPNAGVTRNIIIDKEGKIVMLTRLYKVEEFNEMVTLIDDLLKK